MPVRKSLLTWVLICSSGAIFAADPELEFTQISEHQNVVDIANAGDGSGRLFLVKRTGQVYIVNENIELETPFLDLSGRVVSNEREQGLLSLAFAPDYSTSGYFYVWYTGAGGGTVLSRVKVSGDPDMADAASEQVVLSVAQPDTNHNGGRVRFGPDGMLYLGLGDGGGAFDPLGVAQDGDSLLGKLIRIDVNTTNGSYAVPADNPYVGNAGFKDEIWASGLRNPWRISFDSTTGDLYIGDVGQNQWEEIDFQPANSSGGENYGWSLMEGTECTGGGNSCDQSGLAFPVAQYGHENGNCSVTGGEVYRGQSYPNMYGKYIFADHCSGRFWSLSKAGNNWTTVLLTDTAHRVSSFGLGEDGSLYMSSLAGGVFLISDGEVVPESISINSGMNDAWFNPATVGQGLLITVFEGTDVMFAAWFTYDVERPPADVTAVLGDPGHRWLTAQGTFLGNTAILEIHQSVGGVFDASVPKPSIAEKIGEMTIEWSDCNAAVVSYTIDSSGLAGEFPIQRVVPDNVILCEAQ